jgi:lipopolysaccharide/colanic/teichoic acid biosynthesis glycosyltransferase
LFCRREAKEKKEEEERTNQATAVSTAAHSAKETEGRKRCSDIGSVLSLCLSFLPVSLLACLMPLIHPKGTLFFFSLSLSLFLSLSLSF